MQSNRILKTNSAVSLMLLVTAALLLTASTARAQTTTFTYQGRLLDGGTPANGNYDLQFGLWDSLTGGTQIGSTQTVSSVSVSNGAFTVQLDFGANAFPGANRFLEIAARVTGSGNPFTTLVPRVQITSTPYAIRSLNASSADTIPVGAVPAGSGNYIRNTTSLQNPGDFNISGTGAIGGNLIALGNVGVGTASPSGKLQVADVNWHSSPVTLTGRSGSVVGPSLDLDATAAGGHKYSVISTGPAADAKAGKWTIFDDTAQLYRFVLDGSGNVGIGTTSPLSRFHVVGNTPVRILAETSTLSGSEYVDFMARNSPFATDLGGMRIQRDPTTGDVNTLLFAAAAGNPASEKMRIAGNGTVAIGTTMMLGNPRLAVDGGSALAVYATNQSGATTVVGTNYGDGYGVSGYSVISVGVRGNSLRGIGVYGDSGPISDGPGTGVLGQSGTGNGVSGYSGSGYGVDGRSSTSYGVHGASGSSGYAGYFDGNVFVTGYLTKGGGSFKIDHPLDPANKYLSHSFVESPDMMNIYNGNIITDARGLATVLLPDYFTALNRDFRYQLTVIGRFAQAIVAREIKNNRFVIRTSRPHTRVSWQVTGIREDAFANAHRVKVEEEKTGEERGRYLYPKLFGQPEERGVGWARKPENARPKAEPEKTEPRAQKD